MGLKYADIELINADANALVHRAENNELRIASLDKIRKFILKHPDITVFGFHDIQEFTNFEQKKMNSNVCC